MKKTSDKIHSHIGLSVMKGPNEIEHVACVHQRKRVDCICPKCSGEHVMVFHWTGRGIPRMYCPQCRGPLY